MDRRKTLANRCTSSDASKMRSSRRLRAFPNQAVTISSKVGQPSIAEITSHYSRQCCRSEEKCLARCISEAARIPNSAIYQ